MASKKFLSSLVSVGCLAAWVSPAAGADDHRNHGGGNGAAIAAGILGAAVIGSLIANSQPANAAPQPYPYYEAQPQAYYSPPPVQQVYSQPVAPVYYEQSPQYYAQQSVTVIDRGYRDRHEYRGYPYRDRDRYYYSR